jgi:hypothetical protein
VVSFHDIDTVGIRSDPDPFSNAVSSHSTYLYGMDPPEHTKFRQIIDRASHDSRHRCGRSTLGAGQRLTVLWASAGVPVKLSNPLVHLRISLPEWS